MSQRVAFFLSLTFVLLICVDSFTRNCSSNQYWHRTLQSCEYCTNCTVNQIIDEPCSIDRNTKCGPFKQFIGIFQRGDNGITENIIVPERKSSLLPKSGGLQSIRKDSTDHWKKLAFSLIGVLCVLIIAATIIVFVSCKYYQSTKFGSEPDNGGESEGSGEYVVIRRRSAPAVFTMEDENEAYPPLRATFAIDFHANQRNRYHRMRRMYRPQRRLMNEYVDDVFESEDSGGSRSVRLPLHTIPENSETETL